MGPTFPSAAAVEGQGQLSCSLDCRACSPDYHEWWGIKEARHQPHTYVSHLRPTQGWFTHSPLTRASNTVLLRQNTRPALQSAAASEEQGQFSQAHNPVGSFPDCQGWQGTVRGITSVPGLFFQMLPQVGDGASSSEATSNEEWSQLCTAPGHPCPWWLPPPGTSPCSLEVPNPCDCELLT